MSIGAHTLALVLETDNPEDATRCDRLLAVVAWMKDELDEVEAECSTASPERFNSELLDVVLLGLSLLARDCRFDRSEREYGPNPPTLAFDRHTAIQIGRQRPNLFSPEVAVKLRQLFASMNVEDSCRAYALTDAAVARAIERRVDR